MQEQAPQAGPQHTYFVDDKQQQTSKEELSVQRILEKAGVEAKLEEGQNALLVELREGRRVEHKDPNEKIRIQNDARFESPKAGQGENAQSSGARPTRPESPTRRGEKAAAEDDRPTSETSRPPKAADADRPPN